VFDLGFAKPSSVTNVTAVAPVGAGVTGTYETYYVWYDQTMDHESSPSAITTTTVATLRRRATTPSRAAPRPSTSRTGGPTSAAPTPTSSTSSALPRSPIGTGTFNEEVSDTARRDAGAGPYSSDNDPPPGAFAILQVWKGFGIGVLASDDSYYVSQVGDLESWAPKNKFPVNRGDGEAITSVLPFGTDILVHKGHQTYRLLGDVLPFKLDPLHSRWGNVSQESGLEVDGKFYGWDRERGPYATDTVNWDVARRRLDHAGARDGEPQRTQRHPRGLRRAAHVIKWAVPVTGSTRKRMIMKYHVGLNAWLPPDTGLEYGSLCTFTTNSDGTLGVYMGDYWGRIFQLGSGDREGVARRAASAPPLSGRSR
jgi:hypothetical protein